MEREQSALEQVRTEVKLYVNERLFQRQKITEDTYRRAKAALLKAPVKAPMRKNGGHSPAASQAGGAGSPERRKGGARGEHGPVSSAQ